MRMVCLNVCHIDLPSTMTTHPYSERGLRSRCCGWGHIAPHCKAAARCVVCAGDHTMNDHWCPIDGCRVGRGRPCPHGQTRCVNCGGPHRAWADACAAKKTARQLARGWKTPPPPSRERKAPGAETTAAQGEGKPGEAASAKQEMVKKYSSSIFLLIPKIVSTKLITLLWLTLGVSQRLRRLKAGLGDSHLQPMLPGGSRDRF